MEREILKDAGSDTPTFSVVPVTRAVLPEISRWPATGGSLRYRWIERTGGPASSILKTGDRIDLVVWDSDVNSLLTAPGQKTAQIQDLAVSPEGTVYIPYVGDVVVRGLTESQAREEIQARLSQIATSAQVQMAVRAGQENTVDVVSGVGRPGRVPLNGRNVSILSVLAQAGGISTQLNNPLVRLFRGGSTYETRSDDLFSDARRNITLRGGDKIVVEEDARYFTGFGATGIEKLVTFDREKITAIEALSMLGGLSERRANPKGVLILRQYPAPATRPRAGFGPDLPDVIFTFDLTSADGLFAARKFRVFPNDTVIATESPLPQVTSVIGVVSSLVNIRSDL